MKTAEDRDKLFAEWWAVYNKDGRHGVVSGGTVERDCQNAFYAACHILQSMHDDTVRKCCAAVEKHFDEYDVTQIIGHEVERTIYRETGVKP